MSRRTVFAVLFALLAAALLFGPLPSANTYAERTIENAGHMPLFLVATLFLLGILRHDFRIDGVRQYGLAGLLGVGAGLASELIQRPFQRDASWEDVFADALGVACALALYRVFDARPGEARWIRMLAATVALACLVVFIAPIAVMARAYLHRDGQFPVLADFSSDADLTWVVGYGVNRELVDGALQIDFVSDVFPGLSLFEPVPDWRRFRTLVVDVENPADLPLAFAVRVHDRGHGRQYADRFNRNFDIAPRTRTTLRVALDDIAHAPRGRLMNMAQISDITLFRVRTSGSRQARLHSLRLE